MITLNGKRFAQSQSEFDDSQYEDEGACVGFYEHSKGEVILMDAQRNRIGVINPHAVICCARRLGRGRYWYSHADIALIGRFESYRQQVTEAKRALAAVPVPTGSEPETRFCRSASDTCYRTPGRTPGSSTICERNRIMTTTEAKHRILITVEGGVIQGIDQIPAGVTVEVRDYDTIDIRDRGHPNWSEEHQAFVSEWAGPERAVTGLYRYRRDTDGTDETFDIYRHGDGRPMVSVGFWEKEAEAEATTRLIVEALNQHAVRTAAR